MKKKILLSVLAIFVFAIFMINVNAKDSFLGIGNDTKAKTPETVPGENSTLYGTVTEKFDFSKIKFKTTNDGTEEGKPDLRKIILGTLNVSNLTNGTANSADTAFNKWFTAYCLDGTLKYPEFGIYSNVNYNIAYNGYVQAKTAAATACQDQTSAACATAMGSMKTAAVGMLNAIVRAAVLNDPGVQKAITDEFASYTIAIETSLMLDPSEPGYTVIDSTNVDEISAKVTEVLTAFSESKTSFPVKIYGITFTNASLDQKTLTGAEINAANNKSGNAYELTVNAMNVIFDKYTATTYTDAKGYKQALWIIEHSYPSLSLEDALNAAGANYDALKTEIASIYNLTDATQIETYTENAVYGTVQYAIWKVHEGIITSDGGKLGDAIKNSEQLNHLYQYLIQDRVISDDYATGMSFTNKISIDMPDDGKEIYKKTDSVYTYGPYAAEYDALDGGNLQVSVVTDDADGVKIVDAEGNEITEVEPNQDFFVQVPKTAKLGNITIKLAARVSAFNPDGLRGRIYYPVFTLGQNVMSGGKIENKDIDKTFDIVINAKTGVEDIAVLLMVTLIAFSLGYLVLSYKGKPVELN